MSLISRLSTAGVVLCCALRADDASDRATFQKICGNCHATSMVHDLKTQDEWVETVGNMASIGAKGTDAEFDAVLRYLARNFAKVNINTAGAAEIAPVLDVSDAMAQTIVDYRNAHGSFASVEQIAKLPGVDAAKVEARKERIAFR